MKIVYTLRARQDLQNIYEYIAFTLFVPDIARRTTDKIMDKIRTLDAMPERNPLYKEEPWCSQGIRFLPVNHYLIFYAVDHTSDTVSIVRIMYAGRDIRHQLGN